MTEVSRRRSAINYFWLLTNTFFLVIIGLIMVISASVGKSETGNLRALTMQIIYTLAGLFLLFLASLFPPSFFMRFSNVFLIVAIILQLGVLTPLAIEYGGNTNWVRLGPITFQPSEFLKLALVLSLAAALVRKQEHLKDKSKTLIPLALGALGVIALVFIGRDLGTIMIMVLLFFGAIIFAGLPGRHLLLAFLGSVGLLAVGALLSPSRVSRIKNFLEISCDKVDEHYLDLCWQPLQSVWAMANGNLTGVGLGKSVAKWSWLPAAESDYIFAIAGEELGMIGAILILALFFSLALVLLRIITDAQDIFSRAVTGAVLFWIVGQALVNIAVVLRLMPVLGVPLPFISAGGSALLSSMMGVGVVLSIIRKRRVRV